MSNWKGEELSGWGNREDPIELPEITSADSERILALMRQVPKGTYSELTLRILIGRAKGERPKDVRIKDIPLEIRRVGNRWGVTFDIVTEKYKVWGGGAVTKGYVPRYTGPVKPEWQKASEDIIRNMPHSVMKHATFVVYFARTARRIGYKKLHVTCVADCILQGRIQVPVIVGDKDVETVGGKADRMIHR